MGHDPPQLKTYIDGTLNSVIQYCLPIYSNCWGDVGRAGVTYNTLCTKDDQRRIQVLQNKAMRCLVKRMEMSPWEELAHMGTGVLVAKTGMLSVNQMTAMSILTAMHKILHTRKPKFVADRLKQSRSRHCTVRVSRPTSHQLKLTGEGFLEKGTRVWNMVPVDLRKDPNLRRFKLGAKSWVKENILPKPT